MYIFVNYNTKHTFIWWNVISNMNIQTMYCIAFQARNWVVGQQNMSTSYTWCVQLWYDHSSHTHIYEHMELYINIYLEIQKWHLIQLSCIKCHVDMSLDTAQLYQVPFLGFSDCVSVVHWIHIWHTLIWVLIASHSWMYQHNDALYNDLYSFVVILYSVYVHIIYTFISKNTRKYYWKHIKKTRKTHNFVLEKFH